MSKAETGNEGPRVPSPTIRALPSLVLQRSGEVSGFNDLASRLLGLNLFRRPLEHFLRFERPLQTLIEGALTKGQLVATAVTKSAPRRTLLSVFLTDVNVDRVVVMFVPGYLDLNDSLEQITDAMVRHKSLDRVLRIITETARKLCDADRAYIKILDVELDVLRFMALSSDPPEDFPEAVSDPRRGMTGYAFTNRVILRSDNVSDEPADRRYAGVFTDTVSKIVVPLLYATSVAEEQCFGVLTVDGNKVAQFGQEHEEILVVLAKHASLAVANGRALRELHLAHEQVMMELRQRPELRGGRNLLHVGKNAVRDAAHETTLVAEAIADSAFGKRWSTAIEAHADKLRNIADVLQSLLEQIAGPADAESSVRTGVDLHAIVRQVVALAGARSESVRFEITAPSDACMVRGRFGELLFMVYNLVINATNAIRASKSGEGDILISISDSPDRVGFVRLVIKDTGPGLPRDVMEFVTLGKRVSRAKGGTGLGLLSVRQTVRDLGGSISVHSHFGEGARFTIDLARAGAHQQETN